MTATHAMAIFALGIATGMATLILTVRVTFALAKRHVARHNAN